jgi:hypothetical protein
MEKAKCSVCGQWFKRGRRDALVCSKLCGVKKWNRANPDKVKRSRRRERLKNLGITPEIYDSALKNQGGVCALCGGTELRRLAVDHNHKTGDFRGLLCFSCNTGLGKFGDDPERLRRAARYVEQGGVG